MIFGSERWKKRIELNRPSFIARQFTSFYEQNSEWLHFISAISINKSWNLFSYVAIKPNILYTARLSCDSFGDMSGVNGWNRVKPVVDPKQTVGHIGSRTIMSIKFCIQNNFYFWKMRLWEDKPTNSLIFGFSGFEILQRRSRYSGRWMNFEKKHDNP